MLQYTSILPLLTIRETMQIVSVSGLLVKQVKVGNDVETVQSG